MSARRPAALALGLALLVAAPRAGAQADPRLSRLEPAAAALVRAQLDSARQSDVPTEPLVQKALEGSAKRVAAARIVQAVRELRAELTVARGALGAASESELVAAAGAVHGGARAADLRELRAARRGKPLTVALATLTDLVALGVPADTAAATVLALARRDASDDEMVTVRERVESDVAAGAEPAAAARARSGRAREARGNGEAGARGGRPGGPPGPARGAAAGQRGGGAGKGAPPNVPRRPDRDKKKPRG